MAVPGVIPELNRIFDSCHTNSISHELRSIVHGAADGPHHECMRGDCLQCACVVVHYCIFWVFVTLQMGIIMRSVMRAEQGIEFWERFTTICSYTPA
jgi:hypothetical protein